MGTHRKPKARTTVFTAAVTAAIVVPAGTAAAATITGITGITTLPNPAGGQAHGAPAHPGFIPKTRKAKTAAAGQGAEAGIGGALGANRKATPPTLAALGRGGGGGTGRGRGAGASPAASASPSAAGANSSSSMAAAPDPYRDAAMSVLEPTGLYGTQQYFSASPDQWSNTAAIAAAVERRGMSPYAAVIAVATAMQESSLTNLTTATNYDSLGLFQQRPSEGWGSAAQVTDPAYAADAFLAALLEYAPNYQSQTLWESAQAVQRSAYPTAYAQWQDQAAKMVQAIMNGTAP
jgi:hypothetical protein